MSAISGTRRAIKELVDGTIRLQVDIDPQYRKQFFDLFPNIDAPIALAPLLPGHAPMADPSAEVDTKITKAAREAVKGGELARLAGILCGNPAFQSWLRDAYWQQSEIYEKDAEGEELAALTIREICRVGSRAELDHDPEAAERFHKIRRSWTFVQQERQK